MRSCRGLAFLVLLSWPLAAHAQADPEPVPSATPEPRFPTLRLPPRHRLLVNNVVVARYNPVGLENQLRAGWQRRLFVSESALSRENFFFLGTTPKLNPAYFRAGPTVELQPLSILNLRAGAEYVRYFGAFGFLQSFPTPSVDYSDTKLTEYEEDFDAAYATSGRHAFFEPTFQIKIGSIVVRNKFAVEYWEMDLRDGDSVFYDATLDTLLPETGLNTTNDFDVLYQTKFGLTTGIRHSFVRPIYRADDFVGNRHHRLGVLAAYTFHDRGYTRFNKPTVLLISSWYLSHRWRTGEDVSRAVPYVVLGFAFQTDLLDYAFDP